MNRIQLRVVRRSRRGGRGSLLQDGGDELEEIDRRRPVPRLTLDDGRLFDALDPPELVPEAEAETHTKKLEAEAEAEADKLAIEAGPEPESKAELLKEKLGDAVATAEAGCPHKHCAPGESSAETSPESSDDGADDEAALREAAEACARAAAVACVSFAGDGPSSRPSSRPSSGSPATPPSTPADGSLRGMARSASAPGRYLGAEKEEDDDDEDGGAADDRPHSKRNASVSVGSTAACVSPGSLHSRRRSCMVVKTVDESLHSVGLSHHSRRRQRGSVASSISGSGGATGDEDLSVGFRSVEVREYRREIGDNPCVNFGPPVSIGWEHDPSRHSVLSVDEFEEIREPERAENGGRVPVLTRTEREEMLKEGGHSRKEIARAVREVERQKRSRRQTINNVKLQWFDEGVESAGRKLKRLVMRKKKDNALYDRWQSERDRAAAMIREENEASAREAAAAELDLEAEAAAAGKSVGLSDDDDDSNHDDLLLNGLRRAVAAKGGRAASGGGGRFGLKKTKSNVASQLAPKAATIVIEEDSTHRGRRRKPSQGLPEIRLSSSGAIAA